MLLVAAPAGAGSGLERHPSGSGAAHALLDKGKAALQAKDLGAARRALEQAYRLAATPEALFLLGRLAEAEGRPLEAHDLMRRYLIDPARLPDEAAVAEAQRVVKGARPASGQIVVLGAPGSLVLLDDRLLGSVPLTQPLLVSPGEHRLSLQLGSRRLESPVLVQAGRSFEVRFTKASGAVLITLLPAVLWVTEQVGVPDEAQNPLADAAEQAARAANQTLLTAEAALAQAPELKECLASTECRQKLARKSEVDYVLSLRAQYKPSPESGVAKTDAAASAPSTPSPSTPSTPSTSGAPSTPGATGAATQAVTVTGSWQLSLSLWHVELATPAATTTATCEHCTAEQAATALRPVAAKLLAEGLRRGHGSLAVTSEPTGAQLLIDGAVVGRTPYKQPSWSGTYALELRRSDFSPERRSIEVGDGQQAEVAVTLLALGGLAQPGTAALPTTSALPRRPLWRLATGGALLGSGIIFLGVGGRAANLVGQCASYNPFGLCTEAYDTAPPAIGLLTTGSLAVIAGVVLLVLPPSRPKSAPAAQRRP